MGTTFRAEFVAELQTLARKHGRFHVGLGSGRAIDLPRAEFREVCEDVVAPLLHRAVQCRLFEQPQNELALLVNPHLKREGRRLELDLTADVVVGFEQFWGADQWQRGSVAIESKFDAAILERVFSRTRDLGFLTNLRTIAGTSAITHARKITENDRTALVFVLAANRGLNELHVFAHPERISDPLDIAMKSCRSSERFLRMYGAI